MVDIFAHFNILTKQNVSGVLTVFVFFLFLPEMMIEKIRLVYFRQICRFSCCEHKDKLHLICQNKSMKYETATEKNTFEMIWSTGERPEIKTNQIQLKFVQST